MKTKMLDILDKTGFTIFRSDEHICVDDDRYFIVLVLLREKRVKKPIKGDFFHSRFHCEQLDEG